jgi:7-cyano-7-deazaguanine synthase
MSRSAVAIVSGGMDSVTLAHDLASQRYQLTLLSFDYGQRHRHRELACARLCAARLGATHHVVDISWLAALMPGSALTDNSVDVPEGHYAEDNMRLTVVPGRNADMLAPAFSIASASSAQLVAAAMHAGDHPIYPDCRPKFMEAFQAMEDAGLEGFNTPRLHTPYIDMTKGEICRRGWELDVPYQQTWSCYKGAQVHCGRCGTCVERIEAFAEAGVPDPTEYADRDYAGQVLAAYAVRSR